jgi:beta-aspartyl-peptidase (threonine type)
MRRLRLLPLIATALAAGTARAGEVVLVVHGGAGAPPRAELTPEREAAVRADLDRALRAGHAVIAGGGAALDAVAAAVVVLEDSPLFNAGRGAALNAEGRAELDAAIMEGHTQRAGAVAAVHRARNPVLLARAVMEKSGHVMLVGDGADEFGRSVGVAMVDPSWFVTDERRRDLERARARAGETGAIPAHLRFGTVGAVALDSAGRLAAATSTGGLTNKRWGRVGDSPLIGAGTWADDRCAVSATGAGEYFIRVGAARDLCARMRYRGDGVGEAARDVIAAVGALGGDGGVIALDARGNVAMPFNADGMYRGTITRDGKVRVAIYADEAHGKD